MLLASCLLLLASGFLLLQHIRARQAADAQWEELQTRQALRAAVDPGWQPFSFYDDTGWQGLDADLARELARRLDLQLQPDPVGYDALYDALSTKRDDIALSAVVVDPARAPDFAYTVPYFDAGARLVSKRSAGIAGTGDLPGKRVAVALGSEADRVARYWERRAAAMQRLAFPDDRGAYDAVRSGRADAAILDALAAAQLIGEDDADADADAEESGYASISIEPRPYAIAVRSDHRRLLQALNEALHDMQADGTLDRLVRRWVARRS